MSFLKTDIKNVIDRYTRRYTQYGYHPKSLGWDKGNQDVRFEVLTSQYIFENKNILDIGCGFGDLNNILKNKAIKYKYTGVDLVDVFISEAEKHYIGKNIRFKLSNILDYKSEILYDYAISSGLFNYKLSEGSNYEFVEAVIEKSLSLAKDGIAFDFLSDKVDYRLDYLFYNNPERILSLAYKFSNNIILRNDYMPFEFSIFIFKEQSFSEETPCFNRYINLQGT